MLRRRCCVVMLVLVLLGGNAALVQVLGWGSMLVERSWRMDLATAVSSTFDGSDPCPMCRAAAALRSDPAPAQPAPDAKMLKKADAPVTASMPLLHGAAAVAVLPPWPTVAAMRGVALRPTVPPPRTLS